MKNASKGAKGYEKCQRYEKVTKCIKKLTDVRKMLKTEKIVIKST